jgi:hypothetical protein
VKTYGEIESAISEEISRFEHDYMGRGPKDIHTHLLGDLVVVRLQGVLTAAGLRRASSGGEQPCERQTGPRIPYSGDSKTCGNHLWHQTGSRKVGMSDSSSFTIRTKLAGVRGQEWV